MRTCCAVIGSSVLRVICTRSSSCSPPVAQRWGSRHCPCKLALLRRCASQVVKNRSHPIFPSCFRPNACYHINVPPVQSKSRCSIEVMDSGCRILTQALRGELPCRHQPAAMSIASFMAVFVFPPTGDVLTLFSWFLGGAVLCVSAPHCGLQG